MTNEAIDGQIELWQILAEGLREVSSIDRDRGIALDSLSAMMEMEPILRDELVAWARSTREPDKFYGAHNDLTVEETRDAFIDHLKTEQASSAGKYAASLICMSVELIEFCGEKVKALKANQRG